MSIFFNVQHFILKSSKFVASFHISISIFNFEIFNLSTFVTSLI